VRIVFVSHFAGGVDASSATDAELVAALRARGHEVHVVSPYRNPEVGRVGGSVAAGRLPRAILALPGYARVARTAWRLSGEPGSRLFAQYHVFQPATAVAFVVARLRGVPLVARAHNLFPGSYRSRAEALANRALFFGYRRILRHRRTWVLVSGPEWQADAEERLGLSPDRIRILPDNVTPAHDPGDEVQERLRDSLGLRGIAVVLKFGSHTKEGVRTFVDAMRLLPLGRARGVVLADPEWGEAYRAEATRRGASDRVLVLGTRPHDQVRAFLGIADVCVGILSPNAMARGSIPRSTLEAMSAGVPVVLCRDVVSSILAQDGTNCLLVPPDDSRALADAIGRLLRDPELAEALGLGARHTIASRFHSDRIAEQLETFLAGLPVDARD
jgi:glycosyltransferase involved in cell wall biosynthesis